MSTTFFLFRKHGHLYFKKSMNFTSIDFETANSSRHSACAVGICNIQNSRIVRCEEFYIRPDPLYFSPFNTSIHGISSSDVEDAPTFSEIWPRILEMMDGPLVAHNASFDISVIRKSLDHSGMEYPYADYFCTRIISKNVWPELPTYALDHIARHLGIPLQHHSAASDAKACACIALEACRLTGSQCLYDLEAPFIFTAGRLYPGGYTTCHGRGIDPSLHKDRSNKLRAADIMATVDSFNKDHPFFGKSFVFTGAMTALLRKDAMQAVVDHGGICHQTVRQDTDFLVLGQEGYIAYSTGFKSSKMKKAEDLRSKGYKIEILAENDFVSMLQEV